MSKLFDNIKLSNEQIAYQHNDIIVDQIVNFFNIMQKEANRSESYNKFKNKNIVIDALIELEDNLYKRFGIRFKILNFEGWNMGAFVVHPAVDSIINNNIVEVYEELKEEYPNIDNKYNDEKLDSLHSLEYTTDANNKPIGNAAVPYKKIIDNIEKSTKAMNTTGITFDLKRARIDGLPKEFRAMIVIDAYHFLQHNNMTPREATAILLHEVGHIFTNLEYSYRTVGITSSIIESVKESSRKNLSARETILVAMDKVRGDKTFSTKHKDSNIVTIFIDSVPTLLDGLDISGSNLVTIDNEQKADEFSTMFGLGSELASGLTKLDKIFSRQYNFQIFTIIMANILSIILIFLIPFLSFLLMAPILMLLSVVTGGIFTYLCKALILGGSTKVEKTYDESKKRMERIKFDIIRALRTQGLDDNVKQAMVNNVTNIDNILKILPKDKEYSMLDKFIHYVHKPSAKRKEARDIEQLTEAIMENNLHASAVKFNKLIKERERV